MSLARKIALESLGAIAAVARPWLGAVLVPARATVMRVLHARGFYRAAMLNGRLVLERAHYDAVCAGRIEPARPKVKVPQLRRAA